MTGRSPDARSSIRYRAAGAPTARGRRAAAGAAGRPPARRLLARGLRPPPSVAARRRPGPAGACGVGARRVPQGRCGRRGAGRTFDDVTARHRRRRCGRCRRRGGGLVGHSAGGHLALWAAAARPGHAVSAASPPAGARTSRWPRSRALATARWRRADRTRCPASRTVLLAARPHTWSGPPAGDPGHDPAGRGRPGRPARPLRAALRRPQPGECGAALLHGVGHFAPVTRRQPAPSWPRIPHGL